MDKRQEILAPYIERPFSHTEIVEKDNALLAMQKYADLQNAELKTEVARWKGLFEDERGFRGQCRHYLMGVQPDDITVEDALESLGYGRNGLLLD